MPLHRSATARALRLPLAVALALLAVVAAVPAASAASGTTPPKRLSTFGVQPASATAPDTRGSLTYGATPGALLRDHVAVVNYSTRPLRLSLYATDAVATSDGGFSLKSGQARPTEVGSWVRLSSPRQITVPARSANGPGRLIVPLTLTVPVKASPGDHVGGVVAALATSARSRSGANLKLDQRVATRLYVRVAGDVKPQLQVDDVGAAYQGTVSPVGRGQANVTFTVRNTGNVRLAVAPRVTVSALIGSWSATTADAPPLLLPGSSVRLSVEVPGVVPELLAKATVRVSPSAVIGDVDPGLAPVSASHFFWAVPWTLLALIAAAVAAAYWRRRRRQLAAGATTDAEPPTESRLSEVSTS